MHPFALAIATVVLLGCRVLTSGLASQDAASAPADAALASDTRMPESMAVSPLDVGTPSSEAGTPLGIGCSDGTREGFRDLDHWQNIAACEGAFDQGGVVGQVQPSCGLRAGGSGGNPGGKGCSAADLCAEHWHLCRNGKDVAAHSPSGCEGCVAAGEPRFFLVAAGASSFGVCSPDPAEANDLHGCGWLGQAEADGCFPLDRRMGFADCMATQGVWECGDDASASREAAVVTKPGLALGGVLCCKD